LFINFSAWMLRVPPIFLAFITLMIEFSE
jgi:hypothetical protein